MKILFTFALPKSKLKIISIPESTGKAKQRMVKSYEIVFILTPVLSDEQTKEDINAYKKLLLEWGAKIVHEESWGLKKLAYPIRNKKTGFYYLIQISAPGNIISQLETVFKRDEKVLRYLSIRLDKFALEWSERRRAKMTSVKEIKKEEKEKAEV